MAQQASIVICINRRFSADKPSCGARGAEELVDELELALAREGLDVALEQVQCLGDCVNGPNLRIAPGGKVFSAFQPEDIPLLIEALKQAT